MITRLQGVKPTGAGQWKALCPAHDDHNPSLSITDKNGKPLLYCHAGCTQAAVWAAIGLPLRSNGTPPGGNGTGYNIVATYDYQDEAGRVIFQKLRLEPKDFRIVQPDGTWGLGKGKDKISPVLYHLPDLLDPDKVWQPVYVTEGEKDADRLRDLGLVATCNFDGASAATQKTKWRTAYNKYLKGRNVYILADNDDPGQAHAESIAANLSPVAKSVKIVNLPDLPLSGDVSDYLDAGHTKDDLKSICLLSPAWQPAINAPQTPLDAPQGGATPQGNPLTPPPVVLGEYLPLADLTYLTDCYHKEELGDGYLFAALYEGRLVYDHGEGCWYLWKGNYWGRDTTEQIKLLYSGQVAAQYLEGASVLTRTASAASATNKAEADAHSELSLNFVKRARQLQKRHRATNALDYAASALGVTGDVWDVCPALLPVENGVINLATGDLSPGKPEDFIRTHAPTTWQGIDAPCPRFGLFISEIMGGDPEMAAFMQRLFGYGVSGLATDHKYPILWGETGRNGKDTLMETLGYVLGPLAGAISKDVVLDSGRSYRGAPTPHIMALRGRRLVWVSEPREGARLDAAQVKLITGGGRLEGRGMYAKNQEEWHPTHLAMLITNPRPHAPADDLALWERLLLIPFRERFVDKPQGINEHPADKKLREKLKLEASGILAWLVRGYMEWQRQGLNPPLQVTQATNDYRQAEDTLAQFLEEQYTRVIGGQVSANDLFTNYVDWCKAWGIDPVGGKVFGEKMKARLPWKRGMTGVVYIGIERNP